MRVIENPSGTSLAHRPPSPVAGNPPAGVFYAHGVAGWILAGPIYRSGREPLPFSPAACLAWRRSDLSLNAASRLCTSVRCPAAEPKAPFQPVKPTLYPPLRSWSANGQVLVPNLQSGPATVASEGKKHETVCVRQLRGGVVGVSGKFNHVTKLQCCAVNTPDVGVSETSTMSSSADCVRLCSGGQVCGNRDLERPQRRFEVVWEHTSCEMRIGKVQVSKKVCSARPYHISEAHAGLVVDSRFGI